MKLGVVGLLTAGTGAVLVADRRVARQRRRGRLTVDAYAAAPPDREGFVAAADGVSLYYEERGAPDAPVTVVLAHGFCLTHQAFVLQQRALTERFGDRIRVIAYDHRSHGRSARSHRSNDTIDQLGEDLFALISAIAPHGPLVLVGHSMGGMTLMALADAHPEVFDRVAGVLFASTSSGRLSTVTMGLSRAGRPVLPALLGGARVGGRAVEYGRTRLSDVAWVFVKRISFGPDVDPGLVEFVAGLIGDTSLDVVADFYPGLMRHDKIDALKRLAGLPVAVVCGADDVMTPPPHSHAIAEAIPGAHLSIVERTGHMALLEQPACVDEPLAELVEDALATVRRRPRPGRAVPERGTS